MGDLHPSQPKNPQPPKRQRRPRPTNSPTRPPMSFEPGEDLHPSQPKNPGATIEKIWTAVLTNLNAGQLDLAYNKILDFKDDTYFLRLMAKTGPCINKLTKQTATRVIKRLSLILKSKYLEHIYISFLTDAVHNNLGRSFRDQEQMLISDVLLDIGGNTGELGVSAA